MKLWLIEQDVNSGYDTYDSAVVAAETEEDARKTHPGPHVVDLWSPEGWMGRYSESAVRVEIRGLPYVAEEADGSGSWTHPDNVKATLIGEAVTETKRGVVVASFNAG